MDYINPEDVTPEQAAKMRAARMKIGNGAFHEMAKLTGPTGSMVTFHCEACTKGSGRHATSLSSMWGYLKQIEYVEDVDGPTYPGMWRCDVACIQCKLINKGVMFMELRLHGRTKEAPTVTYWCAPDYEVAR